MKIYDIDKLVRTKIFTGELYDMTKLTFKYNYSEVKYLEYKIQKGEEMRIDLVCYSIYGNTNYIDIILSVNKISNPLNIKEGITIIYPLESDISYLRIIDTSLTDVQSTLSTNKVTKIDNNRKKYVEENYSLPPTVLNKPTKQVEIKNNDIKVGSGLFNR